MLSAHAYNWPRIIVHVHVCVGKGCQQRSRSTGMSKLHNDANERCVWGTCMCSIEL